MPVCKLCDGEVFDDKDGLFYCTNCGTQSQDIQVEMKQEMDTTAFTIDTATLTLKKTERKKRRGKKYNIGQPWTIYEGYQYMIKAQVKALTLMGYSEKLQNCVRDLWFHYLSTLKVAFCDEEPQTIQLSQHSGRTHNDGKLPNFIRKRRHLDKDGSNLNIMKQEEKNAAEESEGDSENKVFDEPETTINSEKSDNNESNEENVDESQTKESVGSFDLKGTQVLKKIAYKQCYSIFFCYIGLSLLKEPVLLSDLIRWCHEGLIPYHKAHHVLPSEMKFSSADYQTLCTRKNLLLSEQLIAMYGKFCATLKVIPTTVKENLKILAASIVNDMEFSSSVVTLAWYLIDLEKEVRNMKSNDFLICYIPDCKVSAILVIAIKLIYHLDGYHELNNEVRCKMMKVLNLPPVESWKEWVANSMMIRKKRLYRGIPRDKTDVEYIQDLSVYEDYCIKDVFNEFDPRTASCSYRKCEGGWRTAAGCKGPKAQYLEQFYPVAQLLNPLNNLENVNRVPTSFPLSVDNVGRIICKDTFEDEDKCIIKLDQTKSKLNLCNDVIDGLQTNIEDSIDADLFNLASPTYNKMSDMNVNKKIEKDPDAYHYYHDQQTEHAWTDSYRYLMTVMSRRVEMSSPIFLQKYVRRVEKLLFNHKIEYCS